MDDADRASELEQAERDYALRMLYAGTRQDPTRSSAYECQICEEAIPEGRRQAVPGVQYCVRCQERAEGMLHISDWKP